MARTFNQCGVSVREAVIARVIAHVNAHANAHTIASITKNCLLGVPHGRERSQRALTGSLLMLRSNTDSAQCDDCFDTMAS